VPSALDPLPHPPGEWLEEVSADLHDADPSSPILPERDAGVQPSTHPINLELKGGSRSRGTFLGASQRE
jgi:hypothetical protein